MIQNKYRALTKNELLGKRFYNYRQWLERFQHYTKQKITRTLDGNLKKEQLPKQTEIQEEQNTARHF